MAIRTVSFPGPAGDFAEDVKNRVNAWFDEQGISQKGNAAMVTKTIIILGTFVGAYVLVLWGGLPLWAMWALTVVMGVAMAGAGFAIAHDAQHGAYSDSPRINALTGFVFDVFGANGYMWRVTHNVIHHTYTNVHGVDEDLEVSPLLRLSPRTPFKAIHRFQHWYAPFAYSLSTLNWLVWKDFDYISRKKLGPYEGRKHPAKEFVVLAIGKIINVGWSIVLPLMVLDIALWQFAIGYFTMHMVAGVILGVVFQLAHVVEQASFPVPNDVGKMPDKWAIHEMLTTANFSTGNPVITWYVGGLNHQIEHHLFPKVCSVHYPAIAPIVREVAAKHGLPYHENPTFAGAVRSHWRMLRRLAHGETEQAFEVAPA